MVCQAKSGDAICEQASVVLMARIVDRAGAELRPADVSTIRYSLYEVDPFWPEHLIVVRGHSGVELQLNEVLFKALHTGAPWSLDDVGYNFRHEIQLDRHRARRTTCLRYEISYEFALISGEKTIVRFHLENRMLETGC